MLIVRMQRRGKIGVVDVNYPKLIDDISVGDTVLVDSGLIQMEVLGEAGWVYSV